MVEKVFYEQAVDYWRALDVPYTDDDVMRTAAEFMAKSLDIPFVEAFKRIVLATAAEDCATPTAP